MLSSVQQIESISKENLDQSQTVSAATQEQTASAQQNAMACEELANMAQELQSAIGQFRLRLQPINLLAKQKGMSLLLLLMRPVRLFLCSLLIPGLSFLINGFHEYF